MKYKNMTITSPTIGIIHQVGILPGDGERGEGESDGCGLVGVRDDSGGLAVRVGAAVGVSVGGGEVSVTVGMVVSWVGLSAS